MSSCPHLVAVKLRDADGSAPPDGEGGGADGLRGEGDVVRPQRHRAVLGAGRVADLPVREGLHTERGIDLLMGSLYFLFFEEKYFFIVELILLRLTNYLFCADMHLRVGNAGDHGYKIQS